MFEDKEIFDLIQSEFERQNTHLEMIASENFTFPSYYIKMGKMFLFF